MLENNNDENNLISFDIDNQKGNLLSNQNHTNQSQSKKSLFINKFNKIFLNIDNDSKKIENSNKPLLNNDELKNQNKESNKQINNNINIEDNSSDTNSVDSGEYDEPGIIKTKGLDKFKDIVNKVIYKIRSKEWEEYIKFYEKKRKETMSIKFKLKNIFNINSDFMIIWKLTFSAFSIIFVFIYFLKYILMDLSEKEDKNETEKSQKVLFLYKMINMMFCFELIFSILIIIFNGGSVMTYIKLPLKIYTAVPIPLKKKYIFLLIPKFFRIDLFEKLFSIMENFINTHIAHYVQNYYLRIFITYTCDMFKYLLVFGFYAHCLSNMLCYFYNEEKDANLDYISGLYYTIQSFTTIGFGEISPNNIKSILVMILTLYLGVNFMSLMTSNIRYLSKKMKIFNRQTSFNEQFEFLIFRIQNSTGKVFPSRLKKLMSLFLLFRRGIAYSEIKNNNKRLFDICRDKIVTKIHKKLFNYLKIDFDIYFKDCENEFIFTIFECMKPKMFKANQTIIEYNSKVKGLYFLMNGNIFIHNKYNDPVYEILSNNLFGEYEFITNSKTNYSVKVHPTMAAYGFVLKKSDWEKISRKYIYSSKKFFETIKLRNKKHSKWVLTSLNLSLEKEKNNKKLNIEINGKNKYSIITLNESIKNFDDTNDNIFNSYDDIKKKSNNIDKKNLITLAKSKSKNFDLYNQDLFIKTDEIIEELKKFEYDLLRFKNDILKNMKIKNI